MVDALAAAALCGVPAARVIDSDPLEWALWMRIIERAADARQQMMKAQAQLIAVEVSRLFKK